MSLVRPGGEPDPCLVAAQRLGVDIRQCVAIEDSPNGLQAAVRSGAAVPAVPCDVPIDLDPSWSRVDSLEGLTMADLTALASRSAR